LKVPGESEADVEAGDTDFEAGSASAIAGGVCWDPWEPLLDASGWAEGAACVSARKSSRKTPTPLIASNTKARPPAST
jgi:hypothetical protein